ncbi:MAG: nucleoside phosphorylase [Crocinitomicaceae bacterium]|jgi:uridine phosphorylase|nr:nucleoside phosphorylase [Crocinitomicaceae bacterium]MDP4683115.1 nucleoside phosphorylase [Crocinitomicaceae bacterium]MDP4798471.1 nucleoside phosphorylase [Crocinitomicaceae bacterium]
MFPSSELVLDSKNNVYHLGLNPSQIADKVIVVGDQDRVAMISHFFDTIEHTSQHREFVCHTGVYKGKRISALSTGIGTDNIDITINELDALANIDLITREEKSHKKSLEIIRIGTCGILQTEIPVHSYILSAHAIGLDNVAHFYGISFTTAEIELLTAFSTQVHLPAKVEPYLVSASNELTSKLDSELTFKGITVTSSGFYGPQGRQLRLATKTVQLNEQLTAFQYKNERILNFEMESSALFALGKSLGHQCATICLGVANRPRLDFSKGYEKEMKELIVYVLDRI